MKQHNARECQVNVKHYRLYDDIVVLEIVTRLHFQRSPAVRLEPSVLSQHEKSIP